MPLPTNLTTRTLQGTFLDFEGNLETGTVEITPNAAYLLSASENRVIVPQKITKTLVNGAFTAVLPVTDDPDVQPIDWTYTIKVVLAQGGGPEFSFYLPATLSEPVDIADIAPVVPSTGTASGGQESAASAVANHVSQADPHTGYQKESEKSQPSGYASLNASGKVPNAELPSGGQVWSLVFAETAPLATGMLTPTGVTAEVPTTIANVLANVTREPVGGPITVLVTRRERDTGTLTTLGTITIPVGEKRGLLTGTFTFEAFDRAYLECTGVGSTYAGLGLSISMVDASVTIPAALATPGVPTGLTVTAGNAQNSLSWTASTGVVNGYDIYRDGVYIARVEGGSTAYVDTGRTNGVTYGYQVLAHNDDKASAKTATVNGTPSSGGLPSYSYNYNVADGSSISGITMVAPTGGTGGSIGVVSNALRAVSGNLGSNQTQDRARAEYTAITSREGMRWTTKFRMDQTAGGNEFYSRIATGDPATLTHWYQLQCLSGTWRLGRKITSFATLIAPTAYPFTLAINTYYWLEWQLTGGGLFEIRFWETSGSRPGTATATYDDSANEANVPAGKATWQILGNSATGSNCTHYLDDTTLDEVA